MKFIHFSDIHFNADYSGSIIRRLHYKTGLTTTEQFELSLDHMLSSEPDADFYILTGDLVHEGTTDEYAIIQEIITGRLKAPVYVCPGNHDYDCYFEHWPEYYAGSCGSYMANESIRIISIDSRGGPYGSGVLNNEQLDWLREILAKPNPSGASILLVHHTPHVSGEVPYLVYQMQEPERLLEVVEGSDIAGIFCGHTHIRFESTFGGIPVYTAPGITFGIYTDEEHDYMTWNNLTGYNICTFEKGVLSVEAVDIVPEVFCEEKIHYSELAK